MEAPVCTLPVLFKQLLRMLHISIDLPCAGEDTFIMTVNKTIHIRRGISQKQPDFMGKLLRIPQAIDQMNQTLLRSAASVTVLAKQPAGILIFKGLG